LKLTNSTLGKAISFILIVAFSLMTLELPLYSQTRIIENLVERGIQLYRSAKFKDAITVLKSALDSDLDEDTKIRKYLYLALSSLALDEENDASKYFKEIIRIDHMQELNKELFSPSVVEAFSKAKNSFPVIYNFSISPEKFYPYKGEKPSFEFNLSRSDYVNINIFSGYQKLVSDSEYFSDSDVQKYFWDWSNLIINDNELDISLIPQMNREDYEYKAKLVLDANLPNNLTYEAGEFRIQGKSFLPETKIVSSIKWEMLFLGIGLTAGGVTWTYKSVTNEDIYYEPSDISIGLMTAMILGGILLTVLVGFTKKKPREKSIEVNIKKNKRLKAKIDVLKKDICVTQKLKEKNKK